MIDFFLLLRTEGKDTRQLKSLNSEAPEMFQEMSKTEGVNKNMRKVFFLSMFLASACATALALPTIDFGSTTTNVKGLYDIGVVLGLPMWALLVLKIVQVVMTMIHEKYPKIDGK